ncbi:MULTISPECIES: hypothetical protein [Pseudomonas]|jgi:hypothetical protein|uniref:Uncharacterized protein n=1 Tax=Pseudomonas umsongensis TaxID=198618 RepID=A0ABX4DYZ0_9PSED|nr:MULTISPECIES: hypothetical protein [Pseudomonas]MCK8688259.1 hypothetical protein [Pseudomonas umsongensis]NWL19353.1 hypothetical protein [Pseudomonas umsongensis]OXR34605.1 hypothetical protein PSUM_01495 [Pseudomonas umsongensis]SDS99169.1 hypothetical protein SAMN04490206_1857 [Pseudomonas umsongensis]
MRRLQDPTNVELKAILEQLLSENIDITVREVARRHSELKNASAFTRNSTRMSFITEARQKQLQVRVIATGITPTVVQASVAAKRTVEVAALELQIKQLVAAHAGLIRAVQLVGGMGALERFWKEYKEIGDAVQELGALPQGTTVLEFPQPVK